MGAQNSTVKSWTYPDKYDTTDNWRTQDISGQVNNCDLNLQQSPIQLPNISQGTPDSGRFTNLTNKTSGNIFELKIAPTMMANLSIQNGYIEIEPPGNSNFLDGLLLLHLDKLVQDGKYLPPYDTYLTDNKTPLVVLYRLKQIEIHIPSEHTVDISITNDRQIPKQYAGEFQCTFQVSDYSLSKSQVAVGSNSNLVQPPQRETFIRDTICLSFFLNQIGDQSDGKPLTIPDIWNQVIQTNLMGNHKTTSPSVQGGSVQAPSNEIPQSTVQVPKTTINNPSPTKDPLYYNSIQVKDLDKLFIYLSSLINNDINMFYKGCIGCPGSPSETPSAVPVFPFENLFISSSNLDTSGTNSLKTTIPFRQGFFYYEGSITHPPCFEANDPDNSEFPVRKNWSDPSANRCRGDDCPGRTSCKPDGKCEPDNVLTTTHSGGALVTVQEPVTPTQVPVTPTQVPVAPTQVPVTPSQLNSQQIRQQSQQLAYQQKEIDTLSNIIKGNDVPFPAVLEDTDALIGTGDLPKYLFGSTDPTREKVLSVKWFVLNTPLLVKKSILDNLRDVSCQSNLVDPSDSRSTIQMCSNRSTQTLLNPSQLYYFSLDKPST